MAFGQFNGSFWEISGFASTRKIRFSVPVRPIRLWGSSPVMEPEWGPTANVPVCVNPIDQLVNEKQVWYMGPQSWNQEGLLRNLSKKLAVWVVERFGSFNLMNLI